MLFPTQAFILLFLPLVIGAYYLRPLGARARLVVLLAASLVFYAWWDPRFLPLLVITVVGNWLVVRAYLAGAHASLIGCAVGANLAVLGFFKYSNFFAESVLGLLGIAFEPWTIILPLGISFFTFQQISYLIDVRRGSAGAYSLLDYAVYVSFFPQLIAGPIVRHNELIPQFRERLARRFDAELAARGLVLFILGLVKKVFFADELAPLADLGFDAAAGASGLDAWLAWQAALAYTLQLYFDFSSYSDMAIGLAGLFGFDLPINFDRPYNALSIREFWRRWHMTLSRFLRDYVYIALGGNRRGWLTYVIVLITMLLCGLWHGAGWTFIAWGGLHGVAVCVNRAWLGSGWRLPAPFAWLLTLLFVILGWVLFRAENFAVAANVLTAMFNAAPGIIDVTAWLSIAIGGAFAVLGPTNVEIARGVWAGHRAMAATLAVLLIAVCLRVGQGRGLEFIYFQF